MELDLEGKHAARAYPLLASLVTPRPIAWVTTLGPDGVVNLCRSAFSMHSAPILPSSAFVREIAMTECPRTRPAIFG